MSLAQIAAGTNRGDAPQSRVASPLDGREDSVRYPLSPPEAAPVPVRLAAGVGAAMSESSVSLTRTFPTAFPTGWKSNRKLLLGNRPEDASCSLAAD